MNLRLKWCLMIGCVAFSSFFGGGTAAYAGDVKKDSSSQVMSIPSYHQIFFDNPETNQPIVSSKTLLGDTAEMSLNFSQGSATNTVIEVLQMDGGITGYYTTANCSPPPAAGTIGEISNGTFPFTSGQDFFIGRQALYVMAGSPAGETTTRCIRLAITGSSGEASVEVKFENLTCTDTTTPGTCTSTDASACSFGGVGWTNSLPGC